jgi:hypothetical protein
LAGGRLYTPTPEEKFSPSNLFALSQSPQAHLDLENPVFITKKTRYSLPHPTARLVDTPALRSLDARLKGRT